MPKCGLRWQSAHPSNHTFRYEALILEISSPRETTTFSTFRLCVYGWISGDSSERSSMWEISRLVMTCCTAYMKKKNTPKAIKQRKACLNLFCGRHFDIDRNVLTMYFWSSTGGQNVIIKQAYLKHHHMALTLLGPWKKLKRKEVYTTMLPMVKNISQNYKANKI